MHLCMHLYQNFIHKAACIRSAHNQYCRFRNDCLTWRLTALNERCTDLPFVTSDEVLEWKRIFCEGLLSVHLHLATKSIPPSIFGPMNTVMLWTDYLKSVRPRHEIVNPMYSKNVLFRLFVFIYQCWASGFPSCKSWMLF